MAGSPENQNIFRKDNTVNEMDLYVRSDVWRRLPEGACVRYTVLTHTASGLHAVHSADFFSDDDPDSLARFFLQYVQLFREQSPLERCDWFDTIEEAIAAHDQEFSEKPGAPVG